MLIMLCLIVILAGVLVSQLIAFKKFILQIKANEQVTMGYGFFRAIWFLIDSVAFLSIVVFIISFVYVSFFAPELEYQAASWIPVIILYYVVYPSNCLGLVLRLIYLCKK